MRRAQSTSRLWTAVAVATLAAMVAVPTLAQVRGRATSGRCRVWGTVTDPDNNPLAGVTLYLDNQETKSKSTKVKSNKKGEFSHPLVEFGPYKFRFELEGYKTYSLQLENLGSDESDLGSFGPVRFSLAQADRTIRLAASGTAEFTVKMVLEGDYEKLAIAAAQGDAPQEEVSDTVTAKRHPAEVGREMYELKNYPAALAAFEEALAMEGGANDPDLAFALAQVYYNLDRYDEASAQLRRVVELDKGKEREGVYYYQAFIADKQGRKSEAVALMEKEAALNDPPRAAIMATLGGLYRDLGQTDKAIGSLERAVELEPENLGALLTLGSLYNAAGDQTKAEIYFERAAKAGAASGDKGAKVFFNLGALNYNQGELQAAADAFERAIALNSRYAAAHRELGYTYRDLKQVAKARQHFQAYLDLQPKAADRPEIDAWLKATANMGK